LVELDRKYHDRGLRVVALDLSYDNSFDRQNRSQLYDRTQPRSAKPANGGASKPLGTFALPA
jgi:hypothetical protein